MAFKLAQTPTFSVKTTIETANDKGGWDKGTLWVNFHRTDTEEIKELSALGGVELLRRKIAGWRELQDEAGNDVPFAPAALEAFLLIPEAVATCTTNFWKHVHKGAEKN